MRIRFSLLISILLLTGACTTVPLTGRKQLNLVSDSEIMALSDQSYSSYMKTAKKSTNNTNQAMVARCGKNIRQSVENYFSRQGKSELLKGYNWEFVLVNDPTPNAFCLPGGKVVVYEGILPYTKNETGLSVVLGHEIAHAVAKHSNERISQQMLLQAGGNVLNMFLNSQQGAGQDLIASIYGLGANYGIMLPFSRKQEYEADKLGLIFMSMAGYNPEEAISFWTRMSTNATSSTPEFLSTHPADANRISSLKSILPEVKQTYYKK